MARVVVFVAVVAAMITVGVVVSNRASTPHGPTTADDGPLVQFGVDVQAGKYLAVPGHTYSTTGFALYNRGTDAVTVTGFEPLDADPGISLVDVKVLSRNDTTWVSDDWPPPYAPPLWDVTGADVFPPVGRQLTSPADNASPALREVAVAYRLDPPATSGTLHGVRLIYQYQGRDHSLDTHTTYELTTEPMPRSDGSTPAGASGPGAGTDDGEDVTP